MSSRKVAALAVVTVAVIGGLHRIPWTLFFAIVGVIALLQWWYEKTHEK